MNIVVKNVFIILVVNIINYNFVMYSVIFIEGLLRSGKMIDKVFLVNSWSWLIIIKIKLMV